ncbi:hypothetical protein [Tenacibaculum sp. 190524A02b]|uniref:hypothetical protein n=1 Tax=Tenacibaculum vairaonense TaxID=3137860 RepID=UPI0031FAE040
MEAIKIKVKTLIVNRYGKHLFVDGYFNEVVEYYKNKQQTSVSNCWNNPKNKTIRSNNYYLGVIIHPDNLNKTLITKLKGK